MSILVNASDMDMFSSHVGALAGRKFANFLSDLRNLDILMAVRIAYFS